MNNLKKKILILLISILTSIGVLILIAYNVGVHNRETNNVMAKIERINADHKKISSGFLDDENPIYIGEEIYVARYDAFGTLVSIVSYTPNGLSRDEIISLVDNNSNRIKRNQLSSLYSGQYVFYLNNDNSLIIMNNLVAKRFLVRSLAVSLLVFGVLELLIIYISKLITSYIVRPVEESFDKQKQFISDTSHELKTPLAIISASAETIEGKNSDTKWINNIKEETDRMNHLVTKLLELSRTENISNKEEYKPIDLSKLVENTALGFESLMFENSLYLHTNIDKDIMFNCNADRIKELVSILIDNAIKHGENESTIDVILTKAKNNITMSVINKGEEISLSDREKIFERFYRVDKSRNRSENRYGLGLSIAKNIATNHNGKISVDCQDGYTIFNVVFK